MSFALVSPASVALALPTDMIRLGGFTIETPGKGFVPPGGQTNFYAGDDQLRITEVELSFLVAQTTVALTQSKLLEILNFARTSRYVRYNRNGTDVYRALTSRGPLVSLQVSPTETLTEVVATLKMRPKFPLWTTTAVVSISDYTLATKAIF